MTVFFGSWVCFFLKLQLDWYFTSRSWVGSGNNVWTFILTTKQNLKLLYKKSCKYSIRWRTIAKVHGLFIKKLYSFWRKVISKIKLWLEFKSSTTNAYESFHSRFNSMVYSARRNHTHLKKFNFMFMFKWKDQKKEEKNVKNLWKNI